MLPERLNLFEVNLLKKCIKFIGFNNGQESSQISEDSNSVPQTFARNHVAVFSLVEGLVCVAVVSGEEPGGVPGPIAAGDIACSITPLAPGACLTLPNYLYKKAI